VQDVLRTFAIGDWQSAPYQQHQNPAERRYQDVKRMANTCMDRTGAPAKTWLLALLYVCFLLNFTASASLKWQTPMTILTGSTSDSSALLRFAWWDPVYYKADDVGFPSDSPELRGRFVGFSETVGNAMTFKILSDDTQQILHRGLVRSALDEHSPNRRADSPDGEDYSPPKIIKSVRDKGDGEIGGGQLVYIDPEELIGRTFLTSPDEQGHRFRARIVKAVEDHDLDVAADKDRVKFLCSMNNDAFEEIVSYNEILQFLEKDDPEDNVWRFKRITSHEGPLRPGHPNWKGSTYNVMVEWEDGSITT
jgi:hypothetical protein